MKKISSVFDNKISTQNILLEVTYQEYLKFAKSILDNNSYQRKRVKSSKSVYSQLKADLIQGCVIPPLVLASEREYDTAVEQENLLPEILEQSMILDGLQRTYTLIDAYNEILKESNEEKLKTFLGSCLRIEIYLGINRFGILYRMLTLNTGQTPMSLRHQIEILYSDYNSEFKNVILLKEVENVTPRKLGEYKFSEIVDGFVSYLQSTFLPMGRSSILETIKTLDTISNEDLKKDLFTTFVNTFQKFVEKLDDVFTNDCSEFDDELMEDQRFLSSGASSAKEYLFSGDIFNLVSKSQFITAFGAGISSLKEKGVIKSIDDINKLTENIVPGEDNNIEWFLNLNAKLYDIKQRSNKIGNSQRMFLSYFVASLFSQSLDSKELELNDAVEKAYTKYRIVME